MMRQLPSPIFLKDFLLSQFGTELLKQRIPFEESRKKLPRVGRSLKIVDSLLILTEKGMPGSAGRPIIELRASSPAVEVLTITGGGSTIKGLVLNGFNAAIKISVGGGNFVQGNHIGTNAAGSATLRSRVGSELHGRWKAVFSDSLYLGSFPSLLLRSETKIRSELTDTRAARNLINVVMENRDLYVGKGTNRDRESRPFSRVTN